MIDNLANDEVWKPIPGWPYEASSLGRIRRSAGRTAGCILKGCICKKTGYVMVAASRNGTRWMTTAQTLVCLAFHGARPSGGSRGHQAAHKNGVHSDNRSENLYWATRSQNELDKRRHGTASIGSHHGSAAITEDDVAEIKQRLRSGESQLEIADDYHVHPSTISNINTGKVWRHVT